MALQSAGAMAPQSPRQHERHLTLVFILFALVFLTLPTLLLGLSILHYLMRRPSTWVRTVVAIVAVLGLLPVWSYRSALQSQYSQLYQSSVLVVRSVFLEQSLSSVVPAVIEYLVLSVMTIPLAPTLGGGMDVWNRLRKWFRLFRTPEEMAREWEEHERKREARLEQQARRQIGALPNRDRTSELLMGSILDGDTLPRGRDSIGAIQRGKWLYLTDHALSEHLFVLGATGSGKSTALKRLCAEVLANTQRDLFVIDGKGEEDFVQDLRELIWTYRGLEPSVVRLGGLKSGDKYNAFCGTKEAIYNRLAAMVGTSQAEGNATYVKRRVFLYPGDN
jgi:hypothetical protein